MTHWDHGHNISVFTEYSEEDAIVRGMLMWNEQQPTDTYTLDMNGVLSIELDRHFPIRPSAIVWEASHGIGTETVLEACFGPEVTEAMIAAWHREGAAIVDLSFSQQQRLAIAEAQLHSPSTPPLLKRSLRAMFGQLRMAV